MPPIYFDHAATTPLDPRVLEAMMPFLQEAYGNPSSVHGLGRKARFEVEESRERIAAMLGAEPGEIIFTSGGTEADNMAVLGFCSGLITTGVEHEAVLRPAEALGSRGYPVEILPPSPDGTVTPQQVAGALSGTNRLVSAMYVNNEIGSVNPVREIARVCHERNALLHSDAVQAAGLFPLEVGALGVDLMTLSAHKVYGPKGAGLLYVRGGLDIDPLLKGGSQERKRRGGTENVPAIVGMARALELAMQEREEQFTHLGLLRRRFLDNLRNALDGFFVCNSPEQAAPHIVNVSFPPRDGRVVDGEMLLLNLDMAGICVSSGSACTSGALEPSHVLLAMGRDRATAAATVRFSFGRGNSADEVDYAVDRLAGILRRMRQ